ncbi:Ras-related Rab-37 [Brachionus plicatilis]|uniref:Ras-related Rab-37 n=1 Tax=Brachionus plicatilis TaxID=10195 RepID=A0A3M7T5S6_BRAPC|nr:Ras-related Rab-37 [Brachionus plicatilis]
MQRKNQPLVSNSLLPSQQSMTSQEDYDCTFKIMLIGDSGVGKTCLLVRFKDDTFLSCNFIATVGIDFKNKIVTLDNKKCKLQIWDTAGQERFRSVTHAYYRDAQALLLLYDVTNQSSFDNIRAWLSEIRQYAEEDVIIMLLGNKQYEVSFMETSAKTGQNVELAFMAVAKALISKQMNISANQNGSKFNLNEYIETNREQKTWCCNITS